MIKNREEWIASIRDVSLQADTPIEQKDGRWRVTDRLNIWKTAGPRVFDEHLDRFRKLAVEILREKDPQFELDPEQRFVAGIHGKVLNHSDSLRKGLAETLALLGTFPKFLTSASQGKAETTAVIAVREILTDADWLLWASINDYLPMLSEAAPNEFLEAVEKALDQTPAPFREVYAQERPGIVGRNYMTGLLWALETLAWHPEHLTRVIVLLGELAVVDPGGNWSNRPFNSLVDILLPWHPQTCADIPKRKTAIAALITEQRQVGWRLLLALLPSAHGVTSGTRRPAWRPFIPESWQETVTNKDYWEQVAGYADMAVDIAAKDISRLIELIDRLPSVPDPARFRLIGHLQSNEIAGLSEAERQPIWEALVSLASKHRKFSEAKWAMQSDEIAKIEKTAAKLTPKSTELVYHRLFSAAEFDLFEEKSDFEEQRRKLDAKRQEAVAKIFSRSGIDGVVAFARSVAAPEQVGAALGVLGDNSTDATILPLLLDSEPKSQRFSAGFIWSRFRTKGWGWVDGLPIKFWNDEQRANFLTKLPFERGTWERAEELLGARQPLYWTQVNVNPYQARDHVLAAVEPLLEHGRARAAIECLEILAIDKVPIPPSLVIHALRANLTSEESASAFDQHVILELIKWLQANPDTDGEELFQIEWSYLPLLDRFSGGAPKTLEWRLAHDPNFFCEVIRLVFRSKKEELPKEEPSEDRKKIAHNAYRLLHEWQTPPGSDAQGQLQPTIFNEWLAAVRKSTQKSGHYAVAMSLVGQVLPYSPPDPNGLWIHGAIAKALNAKDADEMRSGFMCELFNKRGTHSFTRGREEREIAARYREKADAAENAGYHRLATSLRKLSASYERDAERDSTHDPFSE